MNTPLKQTSITGASANALDPRLAFLARAAAAHDLVILGEVGLDEVFDGLVPAFETIMQYDECDMCGASPCRNPSFCEACRQTEQRRDARTSQQTIDDILGSVRERGLAALHELHNIERLSRCDERALREIDRRLSELQEGA